MNTPTLSPSRQEDAETVRIAFELGAVSRSVYMNLLRRIYREQRAEDAAAVLAKQKAREAKLKAQRKAQRERAKARRAPVAVSAEVRIPVKKASGKGDVFEIRRTVVFTAPANKVKQVLAEKIAELVAKTETDSPIVMSGLAKTTSVSTTPIGVGASATATFMKQAGSLFLDGEERHEFDSGEGCCVFDWLEQRYGDVRGCKKLATRAALVALFGAEALETGVRPIDLDAFCDAAGCRQYALDETHKVIHHYTPAKLNNNIPPLVYRVKNGHLYPIVSEAASVCQMVARATTLAHERKPAEVEEVAADPLEVVVLEQDDRTPEEQLVAICQAQTTEAYSRKKAPLTYVDGRLASFKLNGTLYTFAEDEMLNAARRVFDMNGYLWRGESIPTMLKGQMDHLSLTERSSFNPHANAALLQAKSRAHYGHLLGDACETLEPAESRWAADICKAYSSCIIKPAADWLIYDSACEWVPWFGSVVVPGLYFVKTDDMRLFHGSNIYSHTIIQRAAAEGIAFELLHHYAPRRVLARDYFATLVESVKLACQGDWSLMKLFFNALVGTMARTSFKTTTARMDTDVNRVWADFNNKEAGGSPFINRVGESGYYIYGRHRETEVAEHNLPMWIQILDQSNILLFDLVKAGEAAGGKLVGRKTDCAVFDGGEPLPELPGVGGWRPCEVPTMRAAKPAEVRGLSPVICEREGWNILPITSSSEVDAAFSVLKKSRGLMITGFAGTGKSHLIKMLRARWIASGKRQAISMAFTNKAAINIGGKTIHRVLAIDAKGKINLRGLRQKYGRAAVLIIVDEISMISSDLWRKLAEVKKALPQSVWILAGDRGQLPPVGEEDADHFNSSTVQFLANGTHINLTEIQRYDLELAAAAANARNGLPVSLPVSGVLAGARHIAYLNRTRKAINEQMNQKRGEFVPYDGDHEMPQSAWLYAGLPVAAYKTRSESGEVAFANGERFTVVAVGKRVKMVSQRPEGEHFAEVGLDEFHSWFVLDFCATVHKSQGDTIDGPVCIHDAERMSRKAFYTALTRAKKLSQITVGCPISQS